MELKVNNLHFSYAAGQRTVLDGVSFSATGGDLIALVGPNGVGKSTLFRCILGFMKGYTGSIQIDGIETKTLTRQQLARCVAYIPQSSSQVFDYSVIELVLMGMATRLSLLQTPGKTEEQEALEVLEQLGIGHLAYRGCGQISGGEYQLVLLARALVQQAKILIMDEPTANLDYGNQYRVMERIAGLTNRDFVVMTSAHDPNQVLLHATRALVLEAGHITADGTPRAVLTNETLSRLYGITVHRKEVEDEGRTLLVCVPSGAAGAADGVAGVRAAGAAAGATHAAGAIGVATTRASAPAAGAADAARAAEQGALQ